MLDVGGVVRRFGAAGADGFALHLDRLRLRPGACLAVTGPSGCGKSTLLGVLGLALRPDVGERLLLCGVDALHLWRDRHDAVLTALRARYLGFVPQTSSLLPFLSLRDNIALPQQITGRRDPAFAASVSAELGLEHVLDRRPAQVSVGQRQRAAVARALAHRPAVVLADEPTASVHPAQAAEVMALLARLARTASTVLVVATHDPAGAEAAGFTIAPCTPNGPGATRFRWGDP